MSKHVGTRQDNPRITHTRLIVDADQKQTVFIAMFSATAGCFPITINDGLGGYVRPIDPVPDLYLFPLRPTGGWSATSLRHPQALTSDVIVGFHECTERRNET